MERILGFSIGDHSRQTFRSPLTFWERGEGLVSFQVTSLSQTYTTKIEGTNTGLIRHIQIHRHGTEFHELNEHFAQLSPHKITCTQG
jgi:hypothetical protein